MSIELITGASAVPHISSNDYRAVNRANYGSGRYILKDAEEMRINVAPASGQIYIDTGSVMWYGMHIRCETDTELNYTPPTTSTPIYIYFHYVKELGTSYESVDFVVSVGTQLSPIINEVSDTANEAYTLFASFIHNPSTQTADELTTHFVLVDSHDDFNSVTINNNIATAKEEANAFTNQKIAEINESVLSLGTKLSPQLLWSGNETITNGMEISLNADYEQYNFIGFNVRSSTATYERGGGVIPSKAIHGGSSYANTILVGCAGETHAIKFAALINNNILISSSHNLKLLDIYGYN